MTDPPPARTPAIIGFLIAGAAILGVSFLVSRSGGAALDNVPALSILEPATGDTVTNPVTIVFHTPGALRLDPALGWSAGELHLHAMADEREIMPAAADISARDDSFAWRLPALAAGSHRIHLTWAGRHHGNLRGVTDTITVHVAGEPPSAH